MKISTEKLAGRKVWRMNNDRVSLTLMEGGGHISGLELKDRPGINPFWTPVWKTIEPWAYRPADEKRYAARLLAAICGHNLCLGAFGEPSTEEIRAGLGGHGEAPVVRWTVKKKSIRTRGISLTYGCRLPLVEMDFERTLTMNRNSAVITVCEKVKNLARRDVPFTMCEHVTLGPPFLERGVTLFDLSATRGHTFPGAFSEQQRLKADTDFVWPVGPGARGRPVDLRTINPAIKSSDFTTQLMDPRREHAWFSAVNPRQGLMIAYIWKRVDFPWLGNWEENLGRTSVPWNGKSLTRGMEFSNTPYPIGLRQSVSLGKLFGVSTYDWLPALGTRTMEYSIIAQPIDGRCKGVAGIRPSGSAFEIDLLV